MLVPWRVSLNRSVLTLLLSRLSRDRLQDMALQRKGEEIEDFAFKKFHWILPSDVSFDFGPWDLLG